MNDPVSLTPCQDLVLSLFFFFFIIVVVIGMQWYFIVVLICISLMANDVEHLFMCLFSICVLSSLVQYLFCPFSSWIVCFLTVEFESCLYILHMNLVKYVIWKYFLLVCGLSFLPFNRIFLRQMFLTLTKSYLAIFFLLCIVLWCQVWELCACLVLHPKDFLPCFFF